WSLCQLFSTDMLLGNYRKCHACSTTSFCAPTVLGELASPQQSCPACNTEYGMRLRKKTQNFIRIATGRERQS
uniref:Uncharacterized protein n=1 Tax=Chelonoidis abingdonii TaxID=106734 RepID=A0A8C0IL91_CHEAB